MSPPWFRIKKNQTPSQAIVYNLHYFYLFSSPSILQSLKLPGIELSAKTATHKSQLTSRRHINIDKPCVSGASPTPHTTTRRKSSPLGRTAATGITTIIITHIRRGRATRASCGRRTVLARG
ncbi:hypothetical protein VFPPC_17405 [Pochonia chlamydosporia 170]|uniref:Uncharacterized protein n=1 Tax=Pochonia chlamydosporia 170 TaxID=1380566 RepID=A0A219ARM8_METCM|nr:hypothetical protein VFPPC_17405 [Pochonia chlamydosporia 170]OWT43446.1 hypothetical protein VFPPC_17405 [Pochonia chlamydosporia 170]